MQRHFVIVPFRDTDGTRFRQLQLLQQRLSRIDATVIVVQQADALKFNRGALLNVGAALSQAQPSDKLTLHDVDLLPDDQLLQDYEKFLEHDTFHHIGARFLRYSSGKNYLGGVGSLTAQTFFRVGGFPWDFFGWGGEDDEFRDRLFLHGVQIKPSTNGTLIDLEGLTLPEKLKELKDKQAKCSNKWELRKAYYEMRSACRPKFVVPRHLSACREDNWINVSIVLTP